MIPRLALTLTTILLAGTVFAPAAFAASASAQPPAVDPEMVSQTMSSGLGAAKSLVGMIKKVDVGKTRTVITIEDGKGTKPIVVNYGQLLEGNPAIIGVALTAGAFFVLSIIGRFMRIARTATRMLGRPSA